jgi:hypothetical protein
MSDQMKSVMYALSLVFAGVYFLQGVVTGALRKRRGRSADAIWPIPNSARLVCLFAAGSFTAAAIFVFMRAFPN